MILALFRSLMSAEVVAAIKKAAAEAVGHGEWSPGEKTAFVIDAGRAVVAATPNPWDDFLYEAAVALYLKKSAQKRKGVRAWDAAAPVWGGGPLPSDGAGRRPGRPASTTKGRPACRIFSISRTRTAPRRFSRWKNQ